MTTCIMVWSDVNCDRYGDEYQSWHVGTGDDDLEPTGKIYNCSSLDVAIRTAQNMARDRRLPIERLD